MKLKEQIKDMDSTFTAAIASVSNLLIASEDLWDKDSLEFYNKLRPVVHRLCDKMTADHYDRALEHVENFDSKYQYPDRFSLASAYYAFNIMLDLAAIRAGLKEVYDILATVTDDID